MPETNKDNNEFDDAFAEFSDDVDNTEEEDKEQEKDDEQVEQEEERNPLQDKIDELVKQNNDLQHYKNSNDGRVGALQKKLDELVAAKPEPKQEKAPEKDDEWDQFVEEDEFTATTIDKRVNKSKKELKDEIFEELDTRFKPIQDDNKKRDEEARNVYLNNQMDLLDEYDKGWEAIIITDDYLGWIEKQPRRVREMVNSSEAEDYIYLLDGFKSFSNNGNKNKEEDNAVNKIREERKAKLANHETVAPRNAARVSGPPDDFDGAFEYYANKEAKEKARRY